MAIRIFSGLALALILSVVWALAWPPAWALVVFIAMGIGIGLYDRFQNKHTILRNFPLFGHLRYLAEEIRPKLQQYFIEHDVGGTPIDRVHRSIAYERAKKAEQTQPFGSEMEFYKLGYEWMDHSLDAVHEEHLKPDTRFIVGEGTCRQPYSSSILNISGMSFGAISPEAIKALNMGAQIGNFAHNTGEGGLSKYHLEGGDIILQVGTAYFGFRTKDGKFDPEEFSRKAAHDQVKMIELKLSQGSKPGHGGVLPANKNTEEIAEAREVEPHTKVVSPFQHSAYQGAHGLVDFIEKLRELSGGKPVGMKLCLGKPSEFAEVCRVMHERNSTPDFITVDGGEGGTGASPLEYANSVGFPLREGLALVIDILIGYNLRKKVKVFASGKVITGFDLVRVMALGADGANSARGMMFALGCIMALECNLNTCPTGITTQDPHRRQGLVVEDKKTRVANFHEGTVQAAKELLSASGRKAFSELDRTNILRRTSETGIMRYSEIFPEVEPGCLIRGDVPEHLKKHFRST